MNLHWGPLALVALIAPWGCAATSPPPPAAAAEAIPKQIAPPPPPQKPQPCRHCALRWQGRFQGNGDVYLRKEDRWFVGAKVDLIIEALNERTVNILGAIKTPGLGPGNFHFTEVTVRNSEHIEGRMLIRGTSDIHFDYAFTRSGPTLNGRVLTYAPQTLVGANSITPISPKMLQQEIKFTLQLVPPDY